MSGLICALIPACALIARAQDKAFDAPQPHAALVKFLQEPRP